MEKHPLTFKEKSGFIYVFKYKEKKTDNSWKLATVGLLPLNESVYAFDETGEADDENDTNLTEFTQTKLTSESSEKEQVQKLIKRLLYSKRNSAAQFYLEDNIYKNFDFTDFRD